MKAVVESGGKQYVVEKDDELWVESIGDSSKTLTFEPLMIIDEKRTIIGTPHVKDISVKAKVLETSKDDKVTSIRFKAKKRVHKRRGHRQIKSLIKIISIS